MSPRTSRQVERTVYRVMAATLGGSDYEHWFATAAEAFLFAVAASEHDPDVEVNRCVLRPRLSRVRLLMRADVIERSEVVERKVWSRPLRRASRRGA